MDEVYERLARKLDELPHGFPNTDNGVELRILAKIFSPEDATVALDLLPMPESAEAIAARRRRGIDETRQQLEKMRARGQIARFRIRGKDRYLLAPFVVGIWEFQLPHVDAELAALFEEYAPHLLRTLGASKPALARVVPVNARVDGKAEVLRHRQRPQARGTGQVVPPDGLPVSYRARPRGSAMQPPPRDLHGFLARA